jgi:hypothetical protein
VNLEVPGFFVDQFTVQSIGGNVTLSNVPVVVLDVVNPAHPGNIVDGIVGMNLFAGRNLVIDPKPAQGGGGVGPSLYISDPVTSTTNWTGMAASGNWGTGSNWSGGAPNTLAIANVRHVSGGDQTAIVSADATAWEINVSGAPNQKMTVEVQNGVTLTAFSGVNIEPDGGVHLHNATLDAQFVEIFGGTLRGSGSILTGSGPIPAQLENRSGIVSPGDPIGTLSIEGRFANGGPGTLAIDLGGLAPGTQYDQLIVNGGAALDGTLAVSLANAGGGMFTPMVGNSFTILTATDGISGTFDQLVLPGGFQWNVAYNASGVVLSVIGLGLTGDYNGNGTVDAADYVIWRNSMGATGSALPADGNGDQVVNQDDYDVWRSNFGKIAPSGSAAVSLAGVPEPTSLTLGMLTAAVGFVFVRLSRKRLN